MAECVNELGCDPRSCLSLQWNAQYNSHKIVFDFCGESDYRQSSKMPRALLGEVSEHNVKYV